MADRKRDEKYLDKKYLVKRDLAYFQNHVDVNGKTVLDVGCGRGRKSVYCAMKGATLTGVDINKGYIKMAHKRALFYRKKAKMTNFLVSDASSLPFRSNTFEIVISNDTIEHLPKCLKSLEEMKRVVQKGGRICINFGPPWRSPFGSHMGMLFGLPRLPPPYFHLIFSQDTMKDALISMGKMSINDKEKDLFQHVNKITIGRFRQFLREINAEIVFFKLYCPSSLVTPLLRIPIIQELFCSQVITILKKQ